MSTSYSDATPVNEINILLKLFFLMFNKALNLSINLSSVLKAQVRSQSGHFNRDRVV